MEAWGDIYNLTGWTMIVLAGFQHDWFLMIPATALILVGMWAKWTMLPPFVEIEEDSDNAEEE